jgi:hypothetical protein
MLPTCYAMAKFLDPAMRVKGGCLLDDPTDIDDDTNVPAKGHAAKNLK